MPTITTTFDEVKLTGEKSVKCSGGCGRILKRRSKFFQTINPFNKNAEGFVKSRDEIYKELGAEIEKWKKEPEICIHCE